MALLRRTTGRLRRAVGLLVSFVPVCCVLYLIVSLLTNSSSPSTPSSTHPNLLQRFKAANRHATNRAEAERANGVLVMLTTERELTRTRETVRRVEDRFNKHRRYPWVFLTDGKFSERFKELNSALTDGETFYGYIPRHDWMQPEWVSYGEMVSRQQDLLENGVDGAMNMTLRHVWRFHSGLLARHPLLAPYDFYWRFEPGINLFCDMETDPMLELQRTGKKFAGSLSLLEKPQSAPSVWKVLQEFKATHPGFIPTVNDVQFIKSKDKDE